MIEAALYIALGALSISLLLFAVLPIVSSRARRLAIAELERQAPVSLSEITAQKDQMRAKFAVDMNRQEKRVSKLQSETHQHQISAERWRSHAQSVEMEFDKLTDEYAATKKKFMRMEQELEKQKAIAKSALKTPTGKETQARLNLESEVDQLRAEKSAASVKIVSLQTEISNAQSRVAEMERMMPSLEELSLRKELKNLAEDVSKFVNSSSPMQRKIVEPVKQEKKPAAAAATPPSGQQSVTQQSGPTAPTVIPKLALKSKAELPKRTVATASVAAVEAPKSDTVEKTEPSSEQPAVTQVNAKVSNTPVAPTAPVVNGIKATNGATSKNQLIVTPRAPIDVAPADGSQQKIGKEQSNGVVVNGNSGTNGHVIKTVPPVLKIASPNSKNAKSNGNGSVNFSATKAPTKLASKSSAKSNGPIGKSLKSDKSPMLSGQKKSASTNMKNTKTEVAS